MSFLDLAVPLQCLDSFPMLLRSAYFLCHQLNTSLFDLEMAQIQDNHIFPRHVSMNSLPMRFLKECHFIELSPTFTEDNSVPMGFR